MKIALFSDLHIECGNEVPFVDPRATLIVLAGDIHRHTRCIDVADEFHRRLQTPTIVLAGNHEYFSSDFDGMLAQLRQRAARSYVYFLEKDTVVIDGVRFLGCTLWSNFAINGSEKAREYMRSAQHRIADFQQIRFRGKPFSPKNVAAMYAQSYAWLEAELQKPFDGKTVVITHFAPHRAAIHPRYLQNGVMDELTPYFVPDCSALMRKYSIDAWLFGHTHNSVDVMVEGRTRLVSNQHGYPNEESAYTQFNDNKLIEL